MYLLVGLGNPGSKYANNRHNIGFMAVDNIHRKYLFQPFKSKFQGAVASGIIQDDKVIILKPTTFMNESGRSVQELIHFYKIGIENIFVLHDELDLSPGKIRTKTGGGLAGHKGLKSIADYVGPDFHRVRIGIGRPADNNRVINYVLNDFSRADEHWLEPLLTGITANISKLIKGDEASFVSRAKLHV